MFNIKRRGGKGLDINWNDFLIDLPTDFSGTCCIYLDRPSDNPETDIQKAAQIARIQDLKEIIISSDDYRIAQYFDFLLKSVQAKKKFDLLNDMEIKDRTGIDFSKLHYDEVTVPFDYLMHGISTEGIDSYNLESYKRGNIVRTKDNIQINHPELVNSINKIIDEIFGKLPMEQLDDVDKSVLVSNWIQEHIQFIEGKISNVKNKKFICNDFDANDNPGDIMTAINKKFGVCNAIAKLSIALLSNPRVNCKCNYTHSPGHAYFTQIIDGEHYVTDNTWCITRNPNRIGESLKASSFSDEYLLIGEDKINENENTLAYHTSDGIHRVVIAKQGISRERIKQSIDKLRTLGVDFSYTEPPIFVQHEENDKEKVHQ